MIAIYVHDSIYGGKKQFVEKPKTVVQRFDSKTRPYPPFTFAGFTMERQNSMTFEVHQITSANSIHYNQMIHSVVFTHCDIIFLGIKISSWYLSRSQHTHPQNWKSLQKFTFIIDKWPSESSSETSDLKLLFLLLYPITLKLLVFSEVSFAINEDF